MHWRLKLKKLRHIIMSRLALTSPPVPSVLLASSVNSRNSGNEVTVINVFAQNNVDRVNPINKDIVVDHNKEAIFRQLKFPICLHPLRDAENLVTLNVTPCDLVVDFSKYLNNALIVHQSPLKQSSEVM